MPTKSQIFLPIKVICLFLFSTLIMYYISPFNWPTDNPVVLFLYVSLCILSLFFGFSFGFSNYLNRIRNLSKSKESNKFFIKYFDVLLILNIVFIYPKFVMKLGQGFVNIDFIVNSIILGFVSPEIAYLDKHSLGTGEFLSLSHPLVFSYFIFSPLLYAIIPIAIFIWKDINILQKILVFIIIISDILVNVSIGTNKGIFDYVLLVTIILFLRHIVSQKKKKFSLYGNFRIILVIALSLFAMLYFTSSITGRRGKYFGTDSYTGKSISNDANFRKVIPVFAQNSYISMDYYLTQGYFALDKALNLNFVPCYGLGHSIFLTTLGEKVIGKNEISKRTYQFRLENQIDYSSSKRWHTFYVSIANDLTFFGVVIFIFILGYWFSIIWMDAIFRKNFISISLIPLFVIMFLYFSSNNQVLGFEGQSFIFWVLLVSFFRFRS